MSDDLAATVEQLQAELRQLRELRAADQQEIAGIRQREAALVGEPGEAREQQTATAEILRIIASSPTDLQRVLNTITEAAARLCRAPGAVLQRIRESDGHLVAQAGYGPVRATLDQFESGALARPPGLDSVPSPRMASGRAFLERRTIRTDDLAEAVLTDYPDSRERQRLNGLRSIVDVPLIHRGTSIGVLGVQRFEVQPFTEAELALLETFADQAVIAIENARLFEELEQRNRELSEALEQQTATAEVLRVIASSPTDLQTVLDTIAATTRRLCNADSAGVQRRSGDLLVTLAGQARPGYEAAESGVQIVKEGRSLGSRGLPRSRGSITWLALLDQTTVHVEDVFAAQETFPTGYAAAQRVGFRTFAATPLLHGGEALGVLFLANFGEPRPFTSQQLSLLETFANQAAIAIANTGLFQELEQRNRELGEALEQQTATAEVLRVIASSPTDLESVLQSILDTAARLCDAQGGTILQIRERDGLLSPRVSYGRQHSLYEGRYDDPFNDFPGLPLSPGTPPGRALMERHTIHVHDMAEAMEREFPDARPFQPTYGFRTQVTVPMISNGLPVGILAMSRYEVQPFTDEQVTLLETFASQAVIAIENTRLFEALERRNSELQESNRQVSEALEQQTATAEILRVIASSPTDLQTVIDAVAENAARLCESDRVSILGLAGETFQVMSTFGPLPQEIGSLPVAATRATIAGRAVLDRRTIHIHDVRAEIEGDFQGARALTAQTGGRTIVATPMLHEDAAIGAILILRREVRPVLGAAGSAAGDVRGPGGHRDPELAPLQGARAAQRRAAGEQPTGLRGAGAADRDGRDPARHRVLADGSPGGTRSDPGSSRRTLRCRRRHDPPNP